jgi:GWxTD domain-containing protein
MRSKVRLACGTVLFCGGLGACMISRVSPYGARMMSDQAVAESLAVLATLEERIRREPRDAEAWHRRGMIAWALRERDRVKPVKGVDWTMIGRMADTSLRIAAQLNDESTAYQRDVTTFLLASGAVWTPLVTQGRINSIERSGLDDARKETTPAARAAAIIRVARTYWRAYAQGHNALKISGDWPTTEMIDSGKVGVVRELVDRSSTPDPRDTSASDYRMAEALFREAYMESPGSQLAMVFSAKNRWTELAAFATHHLRSANTDAMAWMGLGLASHRLGEDAKAATAFEYALRNMPSELRAHLDRMQRVIKPSDSLRYAVATAEDRARSEGAFWRVLWSRPGTSPRSEFLSRIAYAEFLWSLPEVPAHGTDTDRGRMHVRYGPPALIAGPDLVWAFNAGPVFLFDRPDGMGTSSLVHPFTAGRIVEALPSVWSHRFDDLPLIATRFRAGDSVDVHVTAHPSTARIPRSTDGRAARAYMWLVTRDSVIRTHDSVRVIDTVAFSISRRIPPGRYSVRAEVVPEDSTPDGALGRVSIVAGIDSSTGFAMRGFGLSDVLFAKRVAPRGNTRERWHDFEITPHLGPLLPGGTLEVLWETYELAPRDGLVTYDVAVTVAQADTRTGLGRIAAQVIGAVGSVVGVDRQNNRVTSRFTRSVAAGSAIADHVTISLGDTPTGVYTMTIEVTDKTGGRTASRSRTLVVR